MKQTIVKNIFITAVCWCFSISSLSAFDLPAVTNTCKPWAYWWWMGSAIDSTNITSNLEDYSSAGIGGVHIIPIYGVKGYEDQFIPYLSPHWMRMLEHTVSEANRLGMEVDMTSGTGWPFGGPTVGPYDAASMVKIKTYQCSSGQVFIQSFNHESLQALMAYSSHGIIIDLFPLVDDSGQVTWEVPDGMWFIYAVNQEGTQQQVKRAAPGAEGNVLDHFSQSSLDHYLAWFDSAFTQSGLPQIRAFYCDSYEVYGANWANNFLSEFQNRRGYDLRMYLPEFTGNDAEDTVARVRHDYNETISDLLLDKFAIPWTAWAHRWNKITRYEAHGSPANMLDLYASADIPETEAFGPVDFPIPGLRVESRYPENRGKPDILIMKFASSPAHITGKPYVSSETCSWLAEHFQVSPSQVKPEIDALFVSGVNHIFFHGITYSPKDAIWPGWLFYASTNFGQTGNIWKDLPAIDDYIARCQSFLQSRTPANDILLYWPVHDVWRSPADKETLLHFEVERASTWLYSTPFYDAAKILWERGYTFDYISDRQLSETHSESGNIRTNGGIYKTLIIPGCQFMPLATLEKIIALADEGVTIIVTGSLPRDIPGLDPSGALRNRFEDLFNFLSPSTHDSAGNEMISIGKGKILIGNTIEHMLKTVSIAREPIADKGITFIRMNHNKGYTYFLTNLGNIPLNDWVELGINANTAVIYDPLMNQSGIASLRKQGSGNPEVYLQLEPGQSYILDTTTDDIGSEPHWEYIEPSGEPFIITGTWEAAFTEGGTELPKGFSTEKLASWTDLGDEDAQCFFGTARYTIHFTKPESSADMWILDLGKVCESARVWLNKTYLGSAWCLPFTMRAPGNLFHNDNILEIEVTNLPANRIRDMDRRHIPWKKFYDINFVDIQYKPFDASSWPIMESGLIGPVTLTPQRITHGETHRCHR